MTSVVSRIRGRLLDAVRRAFGQFMALPVAVLCAFVGLAAGTYALDDLWAARGIPGSFGWLGRLLGDSGAIGSLLSTVASSIITMTSITFSLLLLAVQQGASALTTQVTDQFLMRRSNQFYFGFFVGLSVYVLLTLITVSQAHRPVIGASVALVLTAAALCMMVVLIYSTIDQMRPGQIVRAIHGHVLRARERELALLSVTRNEPATDADPVLVLRSRDTGQVVGLDVARLREAVGNDASVEIEMLVTVGTYAAFDDPVAAVRTRGVAGLDPGTRERLEDGLRRALRFADARDLKADPSFGIYQLAIIGWTSGSTAKSNPSPATAAIQAFRDILARWSACEEPTRDNRSPVVYVDRSEREAVSALEQLTVVASESIQPHTIAELMHTVAILLPRSRPAVAAALADLARRSLSCLGEHVLTSEVERSLDELVEALEGRGFADEAAEGRAARDVFTASLGKLGSRSTRAPPTN